MAKIIITVEDLPGDKVKITSEPNYETFLRMENSGHDLTSAHGYAIKMLNEARKLSKQQSATNLITLPKIGRF